MKKNKGLILSSAAAVLAPVALVAQPVLAENVWSNPHAVASSERWSGLKSAKDGGPNVAYVDKAGLSATEVAESKSFRISRHSSVVMVVVWKMFHFFQKA